MTPQPGSAYLDHDGMVWVSWSDGSIGLTHRGVGCDGLAFAVALFGLVKVAEGLSDATCSAVVSANRARNPALARLLAGIDDGDAERIDEPGRGLRWAVGQ